MTRIGWLTHDHFAPLVGDGFEMALDDGGTLALELTEATTSAEPGGAGPDGQQRDQFSLVFHGPAAPVVPQGTYLLAHDDLGELELFLVPLGPDPGGMRYEAAFA